MTDKPAAYQLGIYISAFFVVVFGIFSYWSLSYYKSILSAMRTVGMNYRSGMKLKHLRTV
jgi:hypothetical protein